MRPEITVVMSTYNGEKYISEQIDSIINQRNVEVKIYIRDDGSKDNTREIIENYAKLHHNIFYEFGENLGFSKSFLYALKNAPNAQYYAFSDQDDVWLEDKLTTTIGLIHDISGPALGFQNAYETDEYLTPTRKCYKTNRKIPAPEMSFTTSVCSGYLMVMNKQLRDLCVKTDIDSIPVGHDLWVGAIASFVGDIVSSDTIVAYHRRLANSVSRNKAIATLRNRIGAAFFDRGKTIPGARIILENYKNEISDDKKDRVAVLLNYRKDVRAKYRLIKNKDIRYFTSFGWCSIKLKILLNKF